MATYVITCDGGAKHNQDATKRQAYGSHMVEVGDKTFGPYRHDFGKDTNNVAEYKALIAALRHVIAYHEAPYTVEVRMDSALVINQVTGKNQVKAPHLAPLVDEVKMLVDRFGKDSLGNSYVSFTKIPEAAMKAVLGH